MAPIAVGTSAAIGTNPAAAGALRLPTSGALQWRNAANTADSSQLYDFNGQTTLVSNGWFFKYGSVGGSTDVASIGNGYISVGTNSALTGTLRLPSGGSVYFRNAANTGDLLLATSDATDNVLLRGTTPFLSQAKWGVD